MTLPNHQFLIVHCS